MAPKNDDDIPRAYKYAWSQDAAQPLDEFLKKFHPSMVQNDGSKPWIWVTRSEPEKKDSGKEEAVGEAQVILKELTERVEEIKNDDSIPVRSNKKTGAKSKKEIREAAQAETTKKLEEISIKHGFVSGKWLVFAPADKVDVIWSSIATSLVSGALSSTCAYSAKVATSPQDDSPNYQHIICVYMPDVYDKPKVLEVMKVLLGDHGLNLSGVKSNLYTELGVDSKHPSGIQSTVWKNSALLPETEIKALKDAFFAGLATKKVGADEKKPKDEEATPAAASTKANAEKSNGKPKLKKKVGKEADPFASSEDETTTALKKSEAAAPSKDDSDKLKGKTKPKLKKKVGKDADPFASSGDEDEAPKKAAAKPKAKQASAAKKRKDTPSDEDDEDDAQSKAKRPKVTR